MLLDELEHARLRPVPTLNALPTPVASAATTKAPTTSSTKTKSRVWRPSPNTVAGRSATAPQTIAPPVEARTTRRGAGRARCLEHGRRAARV
jgi:hypothetical protein